MGLTAALLSQACENVLLEGPQLLTAAGRTDIIQTGYGTVFMTEGYRRA